VIGSPGPKTDEKILCEGSISTVYKIGQNQYVNGLRYSMYRLLLKHNFAENLQSPLHKYLIGVKRETEKNTFS